MLFSPQFFFLFQFRWSTNRLYAIKVVFNLPCIFCSIYIILVSADRTTSTEYVHSDPYILYMSIIFSISMNIL